MLGTVTTNKKRSDKVKPCTVVARDQSNSLCNCAVLLHQKERKKRVLHGQRLTSIIFSNETSGRELSALEKNWLILFSWKKFTTLQP